MKSKNVSVQEDFQQDIDLLVEGDPLTTFKPIQDTDYFGSNFRISPLFEQTECRDEEFEKPQLLESDLILDIGDSSDSEIFESGMQLQIVEAFHDRNNRFTESQQETLSSKGATEAHDALHNPGIGNSYAWKKSRNQRPHHIVVDKVTTLSQQPGVVCQESLLPRRRKLPQYVWTPPTYANLAPPIRDLLSFESVRQCGMLKRKRDEGNPESETQHFEMMTGNDSDHSDDAWLSEDGVSPVELAHSTDVLPMDDSEFSELGNSPVIWGYGNEVLPIKIPEEEWLRPSKVFEMLGNSPVCFQDLVPLSGSKAIAATSFSAILNLATKNVLIIEQQEGGYGISFGSSFWLHKTIA